MLGKRKLEDQTQILSFLTHTIRNTISGGPAIIEDTLWLTRDFLGEEYQNTNLYHAINNIASLKTIFTSVSTMLDTYKLLINDPDNFRNQWREDQGGTVDHSYLFGVVLKQTFASICFEEQHLEQFNQLVAQRATYTIEEIKQAFLKTVLIGEFDSAQVIAWLNNYFPILSLKISCTPIYFNVSKVRFNFFFAVLSEIVYNAVKYSDGKSIIQLEWKVVGGNSVVCCTNTFNDSSRRRSGSKKGLSFIENLVKLVEGAEFNYSSTENRFSVKLYLKHF
jgi:signal transduction histidine kinase